MSGLILGQLCFHIHHSADSVDDTCFSESLHSQSEYWLVERMVSLLWLCSLPLDWSAVLVWWLVCPVLLVQSSTWKFIFWSWFADAVWVTGEWLARSAGCWPFCVLYWTPSCAAALKCDGSWLVRAPVDKVCGPLWCGDVASKELCTVTGFWTAAPQRLFALSSWRFSTFKEFSISLVPLFDVWYPPINPTLLSWWLGKQVFCSFRNLY